MDEAPPVASTGAGRSAPGGRAKPEHAMASASMAPKTAPSRPPITSASRAPITAGSMAPITAADFPTGGHPPTTGLVFEHRRRFWWKTALLAATTIALVPILLAKDAWAATVYLWILVVVHVAGIFIVAIGVRRRDIAPDRRGFYIRLIAIAVLVGLLFLASKGLRTATQDVLFWGSLFLIWLLHTLGLMLVHVKGRREALCPFV